MIDIFRFPRFIPLHRSGDSEPDADSRTSKTSANTTPAEPGAPRPGTDEWIIQRIRLASENTELAAKTGGLAPILSSPHSQVQADGGHAALAELKSENARLTDKNTELASKNKGLSVELERLRSAATETATAEQAPPSQPNSENAALAVQVSELAADNKNLKAQLGRLTDQVRTLASTTTSAIAALNAENARLGSQNSSLTAKLGRLASQIRTTDPVDRALLAALQSEKDRLAAQVVGLTSLNSSLTAERDRLQGQIRAAEPVYKAFARLNATLARMKSVWIDGAAAGNPNSARACELLLRENMWVLAPQLAPVKINMSSDLTLRRILSDQFGRAQLVDPPSELGLSLDWKPTICGWFESRTDFGSRPSATYVIMDLKPARQQITRQWMDECYAYALTLVFSVAGFWSDKIRCLVVGHSIADGITEFTTSYGQNSEGIIQVTPVTYADLFKRAQKISAALLALT